MRSHACRSGVLKIYSSFEAPALEPNTGLLKIKYASWVAQYLTRTESTIPFVNRSKKTRLACLKMRSNALFATSRSFLAPS